MAEGPGPFPQLARFRFRMRAQDEIRLPPYPGSAWRGLLGHGLRRTACVTRQPTCNGCLLVHGCVYSQLFETPPPPGLALPGFSAVPHPFVLDLDPLAPRCREAGENLVVGATLMGAAATQVPYLIHAFGEAGKRGIGTARGRFTLETVEHESAPGSGVWEPVYQAEEGTYLQRPVAPLTPPEGPTRVTLRFVTPMRIKRDGHFVGPRDFDLGDLLRHLYNRLQRLSLLYGGHPDAFRREPGDPAQGLSVLESTLHWHDWTRYSSRQDTLMQLGGLLGELVIVGPGLPQVWPALWAGQWTHVGKGTAFGLGAYRLDPKGQDVEIHGSPGAGHPE